MSDTIIPERGTKAFAEYAAGVEWEHANGAKIEFFNITTNGPWIALRDGRPKFFWDGYNYRVALPEPEPHPIDQWRAMTPEEREGKVLERLCIDGVFRASGYNADIDGPIIGSDKELTYRIRELTLSERNDIVRQRWEAMEETDDKAVRKDREGKLWTWWCAFEGKGSGSTAKAGSADPVWSDDFLYRIVEVPEPPKPRYVPWTRETCPVGEVVRRKDGMVRGMVIGCTDTEAFFGSVHAPKLFERCLEDLTMDDGTPCGTLVQP